jgi:uncharacterized short protein YbdD (DUF466 family)
MRPLSERWGGTGARLLDALARVRHAWLGILGAPDYRAYLSHHRACHPDRTPMRESEYVRRFLERRYGNKGGGRCC